MARDVISVESRIEQVTVYANGARVRRVASLRGAPAVVRLVALPLSLIDETVTVSIDGPATATTVRAGIDVLAASEAAAEQPTELRAARRRVALADAEVERLAGTLDQLAAAPIVAQGPSEGPAAAWTDVVAARRALVGLRAERELALRDLLIAARREREEASRALEVVIDRDRRIGTARVAKLHELRKHIELELVGQGDVTIRFEYQVAAARWAPSYVARLDGDGEQVRFELRAVVAQGSGEDWVGVALRLSTAEPERFAELPELAPQKIGRRQHELLRRGFRAPPSGADQLYADYDRGFPRRRPRPITGADALVDSTFEGRMPSAPAATVAASVPTDDSGLAQEVWDEASSRAKASYGTKVGAKLAMRSSGIMAQLQPAPEDATIERAKKSGHADAGRDDFTRRAPPASGPYAQAIKNELAAAAVAGPGRRLDYGNLRMAPAISAERGRLVEAAADLDGEAVARVAAAVATIEQLELPTGCVAEWTHAYDYAFASDGKLDVRSDATWHSIALTTRAGTAKLRHVSVPREQADVFRVAVIANPLDGPLLPGPIDVYDRGQFLVTSEVDYTPPGGTVEIGLGVDPAVKIARNVEFHEEASGMLRGALRLIHALAIDVENLAARSIELEVRERVPVTRAGDDDIEVAIGKTDPPWERWIPEPDAPGVARLRGGYRWKLTVPATSKKLLRAGYELKIAGKLELVGGNRRES